MLALFIALLSPTEIAIRHRECDLACGFEESLSGYYDTLEVACVCKVLLDYEAVRRAKKKMAKGKRQVITSPDPTGE